MSKLTFTPNTDNIFEFGFMDDFTTVAILKENGEDISKIEYQDEDNFYCFSEQKVYSNEELYKKFNIEVLNCSDDEIKDREVDDISGEAANAAEMKAAASGNPLVMDI
ncbi:MAG: hypothetical protein A3F91_09825 [Flavobacteria bacterium RIFCSPLOWO2_12_FULL_35_11]|nr:MAG: hypothetical protein A3F91_09825 [Flavobacteria bacterium RIFCSPLOWO2_12_FULL_35_11]